MWLNFKFGVSPDVSHRSTRFTTDVVISPNFRFPVALPEGDEIVVSTRSGRRLHAEFALPDDLVRSSRGDLGNVVRDGFRSSLLSGAHRLYEFDPRIGWRWDGTRDRVELPVSRLFDPPEPFSRHGVPLILDRDGSEYRPQQIHEPRCPFCRRAHEFDDPPIWAGANLMWVHRRCWRRS